MFFYTVVKKLLLMFSHYTYGALRTKFNEYLKAG
jgi:hypothetical protein